MSNDFVTEQENSKDMTDQERLYWIKDLKDNLENDLLFQKLCKKMNCRLDVIGESDFSVREGMFIEGQIILIGCGNTDANRIMSVFSKSNRLQRRLEQVKCFLLIHAEYSGKDDEDSESTVSYTPAAGCVKDPISEYKEGNCYVSKFFQQLIDILNCNGIDTQINTPDFVLANYLVKCLRLIKEVILDRDRLTGREQVNLDNLPRVSNITFRDGRVCVVGCGAVARYVPHGYLKPNENEHVLVHFNNGESTVICLDNYSSIKLVPK
jgi:hypothetical protein